MRMIVEVCMMCLSIYSQSKFHQLSGYSKESERELWPNISYENIKHELIQQ